MNLLEEFIAAKAEYLRLINEHGSDIMADLILKLHQEYPNFNVLSIKGTTPEWNDGDTCEHSSEVNVYYVDDDVEHDLELPDGFEYNLGLTREEAREIEKELNLIDDMLVEIYGTNYKLAAAIVDGQVQINHEEYYCGY